MTQEEIFRVYKKMEMGRYSSEAKKTPKIWRQTEEMKAIKKTKECSKRKRNKREWQKKKWIQKVSGQYYKRPNKDQTQCRFTIH